MLNMAKPYLLIATASKTLSQNTIPIAEILGLESVVITTPEKLLFHLRSSIPQAIVIDDNLITSTTGHDLIALLRRRDTLVNTPVICLGLEEPKDHLARITSGADLCLDLPIQSGLLKVYLENFLAKQHNNKTLLSELKRLRDFEQEVEKDEKVKEDLTHMLVHDLKSPISSVMGLLDHSIEVLSATNKDASILELLTLAKSESQHLLSLASNILDVRRMREGRMPYHPEWIENIDVLARDALRDATSNLEERNFDFIITPEAKNLYADPSLLRRVFSNLFSNAVKHTRQSGYIDFRAWKEKDNFMISVRDNGEGIPEADQRRIFNVFEQSQYTTRSHYDTGMGLTFCKMAVEKHKGDIWIESKVGRGSTFFIRLPESNEETDSDVTLVN